MSKVASAAASLGVGEDQLAAQLSTIISVTRQAPETVGTALRTVYARITDIQAGLDEDGVTLGKYSGDMAKIGINVLDLNGNLRNMGEVMEEIGNKWSTMTKEQKIYLAQTMAGQRQYSNLTALFDNFDKYKSALNTAQNAEGKLQEQQDVYMDRLSTHVQQLTTATEHMWMGLVDTDGFKDVIDGLTTIVEKVDKLFRSIGGGKNLLQSLVPIVMSLTSKTVASGINTMISNAQLAERQKQGQIQQQKQAEEKMRQLQSKGQEKSQVYKVNAQKAEFFSQPIGSYSKEQMEQINARWNASLDAATEADLAQEKLNSGAYLVKSATNQNILEESVTGQQKQKYAAQAEKYYAEISVSLRDQLLERERNREKQKETQEQEAAELQQQLKDQAQLTIIYNQQLQQAKRYQTQYKQALNNLLQAYKNQNNIIKQLQVDIGNKKSELKNLKTNSQLYHTKYIIPIKQLHGLDSTQRDSEYKIMEYIFKKNQEYISFSEKFNNNGNPKTYQAALGRIEDRDNLLQRLNTMRASRGGTQISNFQGLNKTYGFMFDQASGKMKDFSSVMQQVAQTMLNYNKQISDANRTIATLTQQLQQRKGGRLPELARVNSVGAAQTQANRDAANTKAQLIESYKNMQNKYELSFDRKNDPNFSILTEVRKKGIEVPRELAQLRSEYKTLTRQVQTYNSSIKPMLKRGYEDNLSDRKSQLQASISGFLEKFKNYLDTHGSEVKTNIKDAQNQRKDAQATVDKNIEDNKFEQQQVERQAAIQSALQLVSALGQVQMGFENFLNVFQIMNDDTLSFGEKFSQTLRNLIISIPMVVSGIVNMSTALKTLTETQSLHAAIQKIATKQLWANTAGLKANTIELFKNIGALLKRIGSLIASFGNAAGGLGWMVIAATALIAITNAVITAQKKAAQAQIKANEKIIDQEKKKQDQIKHNQDIISEVEALNKQYEDGIITRQELKEKTQELQEKYQDESKEIRNLISDYNNLGDAVKRARQKQLEDMAQSKAKEAEKLGQNIDFKLTSQMKNQDDFFGGFFTTGLGAWGAQAQGNAVIKAGGIGGNAGLSKELGNMLKAQNLGDFKGDYVELWNAKNGEEARKQVEILQQVVENATDEEKQSNDYRNMAELLEEMSSMLEEWKSANLQSLNLIAQQQANRQASNFNNINNFKEYEAVYQKTSKAIYEQMQANGQLEGMSAEQINNIIARKTETIIPKDLKTQYGSKMDSINRINHYNGAGYFGLNETDDEVINLINGLSEEQLAKFSSINIEYLPTLKDVKDILKTIDGYEFKNLEFNTADAKKAASTYNNMANALQKVSNSKAISEKDFEENLELTDEIKEYFRLGNNGYILKDEGQKEEVEKLIKEQQRSGWDEKYKVQQNIKENEQIWLKSDAKGYNYQEYNQAQQVIKQLKNGTYKDDGKYNLKDEYIKLGKISEEEWDKKIQQLTQQIYGRNYITTEDDITQLYKKVGQWLSEGNQQQSNFDKAQQMLDKLATINDDDVKLNVAVYRKFLENGEISKQNYETIYNYFDELSKKHKDAADKITQANEQQQEALQQIHESIFPTDKDVDETFVAKLGEQFQLTAKKSKLLDDALELNAKKAKDVAEEVQRYDSALSRVIKNYAAWQDKLSGSTADKLLVAPQIKNAMADTLGISESVLSNTFATTKQNLEDMRLALEGDEEAYKRLQQAAYNDILLHIGLDDTDLNEVRILLEDYFKDLDLDVAVGAELDQAALEKVLAELIKKGIDTEQQLEAIFAAKGVDLDVVVENGKAEILSYTKAATHELKQQEKSQEELKDLERERIKNQKELTKYLKDERDIYHEINRLLSDQERTIKRITRNQQDMYGTELLDNLNAESAEYEKQQKLLKSKQKLQQQDLANKKAELASKGASFDANGNISNYNNLIGSAINNVNSIISRERGVQEAMNQHLLSGGNTSDEIYKDLDAQLSSIGREKSQANDYLNDLKTNLSNYEKVKDQAEDVADQLTELSEKQIEINLKKFNMKLEVTLDLSQATKTWNDYKRNVLQHDDIFNPNRALSAQKDNAQRLADINADSQSLNIVNKQIAEAMADNGTLYKTQGQKKKAIEELQKKAIQLRKGILENEDAIKQTYLEQYDIISEMFEKQKSQYDFVNNQLEHNKNMMSLVYGENNYAAQNVYNDKMIENNLKSIESMNNRVQIAEENLRKARESGDTAVIEKAEAEWQTAIQNRNQLEEQSAQLMKDRYTAAINQIAHQMEQKLTNNKGFNYMDTEWDLMKKQSNLYLDDVNSAFAVKNTEYLYNQALNDTKGLKSQQQLKKVMSEQLDILKEKDKLTQYDVDRAQKALEIEKTRIALEQARNNKTQMRLKRDSQGNYSYQYVADQDNIAKAENDLQKAENDLYNFDKDNYENKLKEAYDATKEYQEKIIALEIEYATATEERRKQIDEEKRLLDQQYSEYILNLSQETEWGKQNLMESTMMNFTDMMNQEQLDFENMSDAQKEKWLGDMVPSINSGIAEMIGKFSTNPDSFKQIVVEATQAMDNERKTYQEGLANLQKAAGQNWNNIKQAMDPVVELQNELIEDNDRLKEQAGEIVEAMNGTLDALKTQADKWQTVYDKTDAAVKRVYDYIKAIDEAALKATGQNKKSGDVKGTETQTVPTVDNLETYGNTAPEKNNSSSTNNSSSLTEIIPDIYDIANYFTKYNNLQQVNKLHEEGKHPDAEARHEFQLKVNKAGEQLISAIRGYQIYGQDIKSLQGKVRTIIDNLEDNYDHYAAGSWKDQIARRLALQGIKLPNNFLNTLKFLSSFDTGGYTGDWSSSQGKLAVLHQKELVLNKEDTANMLEMIQMVREMQQQELQFRLSSLNNEIQDVMKQNAQVEKIKTQQQLLEQSVSISASFPSVNSKKEIEEALSELMNKATQIALKYKKN